MFKQLAHQWCRRERIQTPLMNETQSIGRNGRAAVRRHKIKQLARVRHAAEEKLRAEQHQKRQELLQLELGPRLSTLAPDPW